MSDFTVVTGPKPFVQEVASGMARHGQTVDRFNGRQTTEAVGAHLNNTADLLMTVADGCITTSDKARFQQLAEGLIALGDYMLKGYHTGDVIRCNRQLLLRAALRAAVQSAETVFSISTDGHGALAHIARHNYEQTGLQLSLFVDTTDQEEPPERPVR